MPRAIYRFTTIPTKIPRTFFTEKEQKTLKFIWTHRRPQTVKSILRKKEQSWRYHIPWLQTTLQSIVIKIAWYWQKNRWINGTDLRNRPTHVRTIIYDRGAKHIKWRKDSLFNKWCLENCIATCRGKKKKKKKTVISHHIQNQLKMD